MDNCRCYIGFIKQEECHKSVYKDKPGLCCLDSLSGIDLKTLELRLEHSLLDRSLFICNYHYSFYLRYYSNRQDKCCNPFNQHETIRKRSLIQLSLNMVEEFSKFSSSNIVLIPGQKLCPECWKIVSSVIIPAKKTELESAVPMETTAQPMEAVAQPLESNSPLINYESEPMETEASTSTQTGSVYLTMSQEQKERDQQLQKILGILGVSLPDINKCSVQRLENAAFKVLNEATQNIANEMNNVYNINLTEKSNLIENYEEKKIVKK